MNFWKRSKQTCSVLCLTSCSPYWSWSAPSSTCCLTDFFETWSAVKTPLCNGFTPPRSLLSLLFLPACNHSTHFLRPGKPLRTFSAHCSSSASPSCSWYLGSQRTGYTGLEPSCWENHECHFALGNSNSSQLLPLFPNSWNYRPSFETNSYLHRSTSGITFI